MILKKIHDRIQSGIAVFVLGVGALFCACGVRSEAVLMGHVGDGLYKCSKCLGVANA